MFGDPRHAVSYENSGSLPRLRLQYDLESAYEQRRDTIRSNTSGAAVPVQCDGQAAKWRQAMQRLSRYEPLGKVECGACSNAETTQQRRPKAIQALAVGGNSVRDIGGLKMLQGGPSEDAL
jgi:hypothetical protein